MAFPIVNEDNVYTCVGHPLQSDIENIVNWLLNESFTEAFEKVQKLKTLKGLSLQVNQWNVSKFQYKKVLIFQDILTDVHTYVHKVDLPQKIMMHLIIKLADLEHRLMNGSSEKIQLSSMISAFQVARDMVKDEAEAQW